MHKRESERKRKREREREGREREIEIESIVLQSHPAISQWENSDNFCRHKIHFPYTQHIIHKNF